MICTADEITEHVASIRTSLAGHIPADALAHFVGMAEAGRDVYAYHNPWARNLWLENTRFEAADIRALWPIASMEDGRPYLIPPQGFIAWLHQEVADPALSGRTWTMRDLMAIYLMHHGKGEWAFRGIVARLDDGDECEITLTPWEQTLTNCDIPLNAGRATAYATAMRTHLHKHGYFEESENTANGAN